MSTDHRKKPTYQEGSKGLISPYNRPRNQVNQINTLWIHFCHTNTMWTYEQFPFMPFLSLKWKNKIDQWINLAGKGKLWASFQVLVNRFILIDICVLNIRITQTWYIWIREYIYTGRCSFRQTGTCGCFTFMLGCKKGLVNWLQQLSRMDYQL